MVDMQGVWILYSVLLTLNFSECSWLNNSCQETRDCKEIVEFSLPRYFRNFLTLKWKSENILCWGKGYIFVSTGNERPWIPSKLIQTRFNGETPQNLGY